MPSTILRPERPNPHDSAGSNSSSSSYKPRRQSKVSKIIAGPFDSTLISMQPADQEVDDHLHGTGLPQKQLGAASRPAEAKEEEAVALLHHMHLLHQYHDIHHINAAPAQDNMDIDHDQRHAARDEAQRDAGHGNILQPAAAPAGARENSQTGSSDASAAYNFSGDSDLTAEPILGCGDADDDELAGGASRSSNSGSSSTPVQNMKPKASQASPMNIEPTTSQAPFSLGIAGDQGGAYSANNLPAFDDQTGHKILRSSDIPEEVSYVSVQMATSSPIAPWRCDSALQLDSTTAQLIRKHSQAEQHRNSSPLAEHANSSWLELRLGFDSQETSRRPHLYAGSGQSSSITVLRGDEGQRQWKESEGCAEYAFRSEQAEQLQQPVTLQLLPEDRLTKFRDQKSCGEAPNPGLIQPMGVYSPLQEPVATNAAAAASVGLYPSSIAHVYHPSSSTSGLVQYLSAGPHVDMQSPALARSGQSGGVAQASSQYVSDQLLHITRERSNQSYVRHPMQLSSRPLIYDAATNVRHEHNNMQDCSHDQRTRWVSSEGLDVRLGPPALSTASIPLEKSEANYRPPTASLVGWAPAGIDIQMPRAANNWSAGNSLLSYNTPAAAQAQLQNGMSWQGLLRSMATDPLLHAHTLMREASLQQYTLNTNFNNGSAIATQPPAAVPTSGGATIMRRRHLMYPPACGATSAPSTISAGHQYAPVAASRERLRLAPSRCRSTDLWFSLQEARHISDEKAAHDRLSRDHSMQKLYLRIRDGKMQISVVKSYLVKKLASGGVHQNNTDEVEITCRGQVLSPNLTVQHVRDSIWLNQGVDLEAIGFQYKTSQIRSLQSRVMALCYQRLDSTHSVTLNLLKL